MSEDKTIGEIWAEILNKLSPEEKKVLYFVIGKAASGMFREDYIRTAWNNLGLSDVEKQARMTFIDF